MQLQTLNRGSEINSPAPVFGGISKNGWEDAQNKAWTILPRVLASIDSKNMTKDTVEVMREKGNNIIDKEYS
jgi:isocitrate dehydrogenase